MWINSQTYKFMSRVQFWIVSSLVFTWLKLVVKAERFFSV